MKGHRKQVALKNLTIQIEELEINDEEKRQLIDLVSEITSKITSGINFSNFWKKVGFIATLVEKIKGK